MQPNFLVIGAMKCATTSLCNVLSEHPQIFLCNPKEPEFFCCDDVFSQGLAWYKSLFSAADGRIAVGEGSTSYTKSALYPRAAERVARHLPHAKLIYIVRHPLRRIESHWLHLSASGLTMPPLREALTKWPHILDTSLYWRQISIYRQFYSAERILVLFFEDFVREPYRTMSRCYQFLGVDPMATAADPTKASHMSADARVDGPLIRRLQKVPGARAVKNLAPGLARRVMERYRRPLPERPEWPTDLRSDVVSQLADDTAEFLRSYKKPADFWKFE